MSEFVYISFRPCLRGCPCKNEADPLIWVAYIYILHTTSQNVMTLFSTLLHRIKLIQGRQRKLIEGSKKFTTMIDVSNLRSKFLVVPHAGLELVPL